MKIFKVRNSERGQFSSGGARPKWVNEGKRWDSMAGVRAHYKIVENFWAKHDLINTKNIKAFPKLLNMKHRKSVQFSSSYFRLRE